VGAVTEAVTVLAEAPLLDTSDANRGTVIDNHRIAELPLQSRSPMALATLVAGVNYNAQAIYLRPFDNGALADWSMNGGANRNNEFLLDGVPNKRHIGGNNIAYVPRRKRCRSSRLRPTRTTRSTAGRPAVSSHVAQVRHEQPARCRIRVSTGANGLTPTPSC